MAKSKEQLVLGSKLRAALKRNLHELQGGETGRDVIVPDNDGGFSTRCGICDAVATIDHDGKIHGNAAKSMCTPS